MENIHNLADASLWLPVWQQKALHIAAFSVFLLFIILLMLFMNRLTGRRRLFNALRYITLCISFVYVGLVLKAQPTTTNIVILLNALRDIEFPLSTLYILEPYIFLSFIFILFTLIVWGRGVFCGWLCPYGAMLELLNKVYQKFSRFRIALPEKVHWKMVYLKYAIFLVIAGVSFYNFMLSEYLTEVEPFRTFVLKLRREWYFVLYFAVITAASVIIYRAFCRYLCPLGAALALPSLLKRMNITRVKFHDLCGTCKICGRDCSAQAIGKEGYIDSSECFYCMQCQLNFWDEDRCPVLIKQKAKGARAKGQEDSNEFQNSKLKTQNLKLPFILFLSASLLLPLAADAKTLIVGKDYKTIKEAIEKAKDGDFIEVQGGEYRERLKIKNALHIKGVNNPVIIENGGTIVEITGKGVIIEGFTIRDENPQSELQSSAVYISKGADNAIIKGNQFFNAMHAVWSVGARGIMVENNTIEGKKNLERNYRGNGVYLTDSHEATISGNKISNCRDGMYLEVSHDGKITGNEVKDSRYAVHTMWVDRTVFSGNRAFGNLVGFAIMYSKGSLIADNMAAGNQTHGLLLIQATRSQITGNTVIGNSKGVFFYNSMLNNLASNLIMNNSLGLHSWGGSEENIVTNNSFVQNEAQVKFIAGKDQEWNGNDWSDYLGWDAQGDGNGDFPYESNTVVDHILWRYPAAKLLYASPSMQLLWMLEKQFPILKVPKVLDTKPAMLPKHRNWKELMARYPYNPVKYYGDAEKFGGAH